MVGKKKKFLEAHPYAIWQSKDGKYWYTTLPDKSKSRGIRQIRRNSKLELELSIIEYWEAESEKKPIEDVFNEWNERKFELQKISPGTHLRNQQIFNKHFGDIANLDICVTCAEYFADFLEEQIPLYSMTSKAFSNLKGVCKGFLKWARKKKYIDYTADDVMALLDVSDRTFRKIVREDEEEVYSEEEMEKIINYIIENQDIRNLGVLFLFVTGLRVGELVALKHSDFRNNTVRIRRTETKIPREFGGADYIIKEFPKTSAGVRTVIIPTEYQWLVDILSTGVPDDFVFVDDEGERLTTNAIRRRLHLICEKNDILPKSPHKIRKTYGSILLDNIIDKRFIMSQMGHSDISCTEGHYHRNRKNEDEKTEIMNNIPDFHIAK